MRLWGPMLSQKSLDVIEKLEAWMQHLPDDVVKLVYRPIPVDDEYGSEVIIGFEPMAPEACPLEIGVTIPKAGSGVYISIDTWKSIAKRIKVSVSPSKANLIGLYVEPTSLSVEQTIEICEAVARGAVHLEVGVWQGWMVSTSGYVELPTQRFLMHGIGPPLSIFRIATSLGCKSVASVRVNYQPWLPS
jgi:hypothetical protein